MRPNGDRRVMHRECQRGELEHQDLEPAMIRLLNTFHGCLNGTYLRNGIRKNGEPWCKNRPTDCVNHIHAETYSSAISAQVDKHIVAVVLHHWSTGHCMSGPIAA
jgi:hypothetical protein